MNKIKIQVVSKMKRKKKIIKRLFGALLSSLAFSGISASANSDAELKQEVKNDKVLDDIGVFKSRYLTKETAIEDINCILNDIKKYHGYIRKELLKEVKEQKDLEIENLPEKVSEVEEWRIISRILSKFNDRNIGVYALSDFYYVIFPFSYDKNFTCTSGEFKNYKIVEINGISIDKIYDNFKKHFSYDDEEWAHKNFFCEYKVGHYLKNFNTPLENFARGGIDVFSPLKIKFQKGNKVIEKEVKMPYYNGINWGCSNDLISCDIDAENKIATLTVDDYIVETIKYKDTIDKFFEDVKKNKVKNLIIDFRYSPGKTYDLLDYLSSYVHDDYEKNNKIEFTKNKLDEENQIIKSPFDGDIFVAVSTKTSGAAVSWTKNYQFKDRVTVVGELCSSVSDTTMTNATVLININSGLSFFHPVLLSDLSMNPDEIDYVFPDIKARAREAIKTIYDQIKLKSEA